jgi:hypothetical protein
VGVGVTVDDGVTGWERAGDDDGESLLLGDRVAEALWGGERVGVGVLVAVAVAVGVPAQEPYLGLQHPELQYNGPVPQKPNLLQHDPDGQEPNSAPHKPVGNKPPK